MSEQEKQAIVSALRLLTATPKSKKALQKKLEERGFPIEIVKEVLAKLENQGLLNDRSYAQAIVQTLTVQKVSGKRRIAFELEKRGLAPSVIEEALNNCSEESERERALELAKDRWERFQKIETRKRYKKVYDFLIRRGFDFALCRDVLHEVGSDKNRT